MLIGGRRGNTVLMWTEARKCLVTQPNATVFFVFVSLFWPFGEPKKEKMHDDDDDDEVGVTGVRIVSPMCVLGMIQRWKEEPTFGWTSALPSTVIFCCAGTFILNFFFFKYIYNIQALLLVTT